MADIVRFSYGKASVKLIVWDAHSATLSALFSETRGLGHANRVMQDLVDFADRRKLTVILEVRSYHYYDDLSPTHEGLKRFYSKFGFEDKGHDMMCRIPRKLHGS